jgi:hypothetical protein
VGTTKKGLVCSVLKLALDEREVRELCGPLTLSIYLLQKIRASFQTKDRVSPTSTVGFPEVQVHEGNEQTHDQGDLDDASESFYSAFEHLQHPLLEAEQGEPQVDPQDSSTSPPAATEAPLQCQPATHPRLSTPCDDQVVCYSESFDPFDLTDDEEDESITSLNKLRWMYISNPDGITSTHPTFRNNSTTTTVKHEGEEKRPKFRTRIRSESPSTSACAKRVVFNETMEVRYFCRSPDEITVMKQCAADRRFQQEQRRLRRKSLVRLDEEGDEDIIYHCGANFQRPDEDGDSEEGEDSAFTRTFGSQQQRQRKIAHGANVFQAVVNDISDMISEVMVDVTKATHQRRQSDEASALPELDKKETNTSATATSVAQVFLERTTSTLLLLSPTRAAKKDNVESSNQNEEEAPWIFAALHCGKLGH